MHKGLKRTLKKKTCIQKSSHNELEVYELLKVNGKTMTQDQIKVTLDSIIKYIKSKKIFKIQHKILPLTPDRTTKEVHLISSYTKDYNNILHKIFTVNLCTLVMTITTVKIGMTKKTDELNSS